MHAPLEIKKQRKMIIILWFLILFQWPIFHQNIIIKKFNKQNNNNNERK